MAYRFKLTAIYRKAAEALMSASLLTGLPAHAYETALTPQERVTVDYMAKHGVTRFIMMNEKKGHLLSVADGKIVGNVPALSGEDRGDDRVVRPGATPARIFPLEITPYQKAQDAALLFDRNPNGLVYVIHRVPEVKGSTRTKRLQGMAPYTNPDRDRRVSGGCINLLSPDYDVVSDFAARARQTMTTKSGTPWITASYLVVLPETSDPVATINYFEKFQPK